MPRSRAAPCRACPAPASGRRRPVPRSAGKTRSTSGTIRPDARCGTTSRAERLHGRSLLLERAGAQHRADQSRPLAHQRRAARAVASAPAPVPTITIRPFIPSAPKSALEVRRADELEHDVRAAELLGPCDEIVGAITSAPRAATWLADARRAHGREHPRAGYRADLDRRGADAAVRTGDDEQLARAAALPSVKIASCAVMKTSGTAAALERRRGSAATATTCRSCTSDPVGEAAAADDPEDAVAELEAPRRRAARDHRAGRLDARECRPASPAERDSGPPAGPDRRR